MSTAIQDKTVRPEPVPYWEAFLYWLKLGFISFGGPGRSNKHDASGVSGEAEMDF